MVVFAHLQNDERCIYTGRYAGSSIRDVRNSNLISVPISREYTGKATGHCPYLPRPGGPQPYQPERAEGQGKQL